MGLLESLLEDKTAKRNIMWATNAYDYAGQEHEKDKEIAVSAITGKNSDVLKTRARKEMEHRQNRTKTHAEVFTPLWVCNKMNNYIEQTLEGEKSEHWKKYVDTKCLEITCGEAPFLVSRYDMETGEMIKPEERKGLLDRKLITVNDNVINKEEWFVWVIRAFQSIYGYEFQGDNLLIARVNLLMTFEEYCEEKWKQKPSIKEYQKIANIIVWNLWQMDGLTGTIPYYEAEEAQQISISDLFMSPEDKEEQSEDRIRPLCKIYNWRRDNSIIFKKMREEERKMKFDFIIGNPPYQEEQDGDNKTFAPPIYHKFMEQAYKVSDRVELIHPARFLFNAGSTPKQWNKKMLSDPHLKVLWYEQNSSKVFSNTDIKGGVAVTYRDLTVNFGAISVFTPFEELDSINRKAGVKNGEKSIADIVFTQVRFDLESLYRDYPKFKDIIGNNGKDRRLRNNIFDKIPIFSDSAVRTSFKILGIVNNKRVWKYIEKKYIDRTHENLNSWKVLVPRANGSGAIGEVLSTPLIGSPLIGSPLIGYTQSFIGFGSFKSEKEAQACMKYLKCRFTRVLLGILKITQDNDREVWRLIPLQDFTTGSDIDWSKSVVDIDKQLYRKYDLDEKEIEFIETHVKEMK